ncbi:hypothetical protein PUN28_001402 [Cardiocondyla obscurior]|uniref:Uncharacterized protein n=1 Tax=Cardiocondyla obscurior TaxID=286306 RepID=A0AAW2H5A5_9HYME
MPARTFKSITLASRGARQLYLALEENARMTRVTRRRLITEPASRRRSSVDGTRDEFPRSSEYVRVARTHLALNVRVRRALIIHVIYIRRPPLRASLRDPRHPSPQFVRRFHPRRALNFRETSIPLGF